jgi:ABC-2 type transport system permease protein
MSWTHIARKDFAEAVRSKLLWAVTAVFLGLVAVAVSIPHFDDGAPATFGVGMETLFAVVATMAPVIGLLVGYGAVVGERESGSIRTLLGLPNSRLDVIVGKTVGRVAVVAVAIAIGTAGGAAVLLALYEQFLVGTYLVTAVGMLLFAVVFVAVGVAISASVGSTTRAVAGVFGAFVVLSTLWDYVPTAIYWAIEGTTPDGLTRPAWFAFLGLLKPGTALSEFTFSNLSVLDDGAYVDVGGVAVRVVGDVPFYLSDWFAAVVVLAWIVGPLAVGYLKFRRTPLT